MGQFNPQIILLYQTIYRVRDQGLSLDVLADIWVCKVFTDVLLSGHISQKLSEIPIFYVYNFSTWGCCSPSNYSGWIMQILICRFSEETFHPIRYIFSRSSFIENKNIVMSNV